MLFEKTIEHDIQLSVDSRGPSAMQLTAEHLSFRHSLSISVPAEAHSRGTVFTFSDLMVKQVESLSVTDNGPVQRRDAES